MGGLVAGSDSKMVVDLKIPFFLSVLEFSPNQDQDMLFEVVEVSLWFVKLQLLLNFIFFQTE